MTQLQNEIHFVQTGFLATGVNMTTLIFGLIVFYALMFWLINRIVVGTR
ncbi:MAG: hypothetical protein K8S54_03965 [Spirochaetia bacterium]|nr:hypothetical protein [Spirochaetia bacterium]